jgi:hypothetical protein
MHRSLELTLSLGIHKMVIYAIPTTGGLIYRAMALQGGSIFPIAYRKVIVLPEQLE